MASNRLYYIVYDSNMSPYHFDKSFIYNNTGHKTKKREQTWTEIKIIMHSTLIA